MTTGKTIALTRRTFVGKVMSLLFIMLSRLVITFLPRSKRLLMSWLQSPSAVIHLCSVKPKYLHPDHQRSLCFLFVWLVFIIFIKLIYVNWPFWKRLANNGKTQDNVFSELMVAGGKEEGKG